MDRTTSRTALVIGATGGVGGETAAALVRHGWQVRALARRPQPPRHGIEWRIGDAMNAGDVRAAAQDTALIVHAANPPGYRDWNRLVLPMLDNSIAAARAAGARIVLPGTIYNYGPDAFPLIGEDAAQRPRTRKGRIRVEMERRLEIASAEGVRVLILRAGDYFGPRPGNSWFSQGLFKPGAPPRHMADPATPGTSHAWAYLPDVGETIALLAGREAQLAGFQRLHFAGLQLTSEELAAAVGDALGRPLGIRRFPWRTIALLAPFVPLFREMAELRYLWQHTIALDGRQLEALLGTDLPRTPLSDAVRETLRGLGMLEPSHSPRRRRFSLAPSNRARPPRLRAS